MAGDDSFQVAGEASVECSCGSTRLCGGDRLGEQAARTGLCRRRANNGHGAGIRLDDNLRSCADTGKKGSKVACRFSLGDVNYGHIHDDNPEPMGSERNEMKNSRQPVYTGGQPSLRPYFLPQG